MYLVTGLLGLVSIISPYLLGYSSNSAALWTSLVVGAVLITASIFEGVAAGREKWEYWIVGGAGLVAIFAPFVLGFSTLSAALWTLVIIGLVTILAAGTKLFPGRTQYR